MITLIQTALVCVASKSKYNKIFWLIAKVLSIPMNLQLICIIASILNISFPISSSLKIVLALWKSLTCCQWDIHLFQTTWYNLSECQWLKALKSVLLSLYTQCHRAKQCPGVTEHVLFNPRKKHVDTQLNVFVFYAILPRDLSLHKACQVNH